MKTNTGTEEYIIYRNRDERRNRVNPGEMPHFSANILYGCYSRADENWIAVIFGISSVHT
jgi:hypothetical protein